MFEAVDHRTNPAAPELRGSRRFEVSRNTFVVRRILGAMQPFTFVETSFKRNEARFLDVKEGAPAERTVIVRIDSDLECENMIAKIKQDPAVEEVFPVLLTTEGDIRPAKLNRVVIALNDDSATYRAKFAVKYDLVLDNYDRVGRFGVYTILSSSLEKLLGMLQNDQSVRYAEPDFLADQSDFAGGVGSNVAMPTDAFRSELWNHRLIGVDVAHNFTRGAGVVLAIIDGRCNVQHEALISAWLAVSEDFEFAAGVPVYFQDHGNQVAGIMCGQATGGDNDVLGIAPEAKALPISIVTTADGGYVSRANALNFVAGICRDRRWLNRSTGQSIQVLRVICNCSWSVTTPPPINIEEAFKNLFDAGAVICCSAGNNNSEAPHFPSDFDFCLSVAAVGPDKAKASYSNFGKNVKVVAPGGVDDPPSIGPGGTCEIFSSAFNGYKLDTGTSFATPHASAVIALIWSLLPSFSNQEIVSLLLNEGVEDVSAENPTLAGKLGNGMISAARAVDAARARVASAGKLS